MSEPFFWDLVLARQPRRNPSRKKMPQHPWAEPGTPRRAPPADTTRRLAGVLASVVDGAFAYACGRRGHSGVTPSPPTRSRGTGLWPAETRCLPTGGRGKTLEKDFFSPKPQTCVLFDACMNTQLAALEGRGAAGPSTCSFSHGGTEKKPNARSGIKSVFDAGSPGRQSWTSHREAGHRTLRRASSAF